MRTLVVATTNRGKRDELARLLAGLAVHVVSLADVARELAPVVEDGATYSENAAKKARAAAGATGLLSLADDSGLEVDALDGRPGVRSARFAGEGASDAENRSALLRELAGTGLEPPYPARFRCVLVLIDPLAASAPPLFAEGICEGAIVPLERGTGGFGYDPIFVAEGLTRTMAELSPEEKNLISHRALAAQALRARWRAV